jgi:hypothetical protein
MTNGSGCSLARNLSFVILGISDLAETLVDFF